MKKILIMLLTAYSSYSEAKKMPCYYRFSFEKEFLTDVNIIGVGTIQKNKSEYYLRFDKLWAGQIERINVILPENNKPISLDSVSRIPLKVGDKIVFQYFKKIEGDIYLGSCESRYAIVNKKKYVRQVRYRPAGL